MKSISNWKNKTMRIPDLRCKDCDVCDYCFNSVCFERLSEDRGYCNRFMKVIIIDDSGLHFEE